MKFLKSLLIIFLLVAFLFPVYWMFRVAVAEPSEFSRRLSLLPQKFSWHSIVILFQQKNFFHFAANSFVVASLSLFGVLTIGVSAAYVLANKYFKFPLRHLFLAWVFLIRVLPPITFAFPLYTLLHRLGLLQSMISIVSAHILINLPFAIWFMMFFFEKLPQELYESASIDGAGDFKIFQKIMLPLALPGIATVSIFSFLFSWNEYLYGVIFIQDPQQFTLPLKLVTLNSEQELAHWAEVASAGIFSLVPILVAVVFMQKYLIEGLTTGSVKE